MSHPSSVPSITSIFQGVWVPIVTPFSGVNIDHPALARLAQHLASHGIAGFVAGATTGEGALLRLGEQESIFATIHNAVPNLPIVLGVSQSATAAAVTHAKALAQLRPAGILLTPPTYVRPNQSGIQRHFEAVVRACDLPTLIYNIPHRTGVSVDLETLIALSRDPRVAGIKECGSNNERMLRLVHETPLQVLSGDDAQNFAALCLGAQGTIAASAHIRPDLHVRMYALIQNGDLRSARQIAVALLPIMQDLFAEPNPAPLKAMLAQQGFCDATTRLPFMPISSGLNDRLRSILAILQAENPN